MGKQEISKAIENQLQEDTVISEEVVQSPKRCHHCGKEMDYETYNETSPQSDFIIHVLPGVDQYTPPRLVMYCDVSCFMNELNP